METKVILVNTNDEVVGSMPKLEAHKKGLLHRAVSVIIFDYEFNWLLQKRASNKYHSGGLWTNTCCSHPYVDETVDEAATRRLDEEMGLSVPLKKMLVFEYSAALDNDLIEHEIDHLFVGISNKSPKINVDEAEDWKWVSNEKLKLDIVNNPVNYTEWFKIIFNKVQEELFVGIPA